MQSPLDALSEEERARAPETAQPDWTEPMLATLVDERFDDPDWIYERKLDGVRLLVFRKEGDVRLVTRNRENRNATYPELVDALSGARTPDLVADGEVVAFSEGVTSFQRLQHRMQIRDEEEARLMSSEVAVRLYLFDLLHLVGHDLTGLPLRARKNALRAAIDFEDPVRWTPHRNEHGIAYWKEACTKGWEGVIAKDATATYAHGRSRKWLKFKCVNRQELVVGGFTEPKGERVGFGALLLGYYDGADLVYAGKVGTGWDDDALRTLRDRLDGLERETSPFAADEASGKDVHWTTPKLVAEIGFTEWTEDGKLRHPRFLGLRSDKQPEDVVREQPE